MKSEYDWSMSERQIIEAFWNLFFKGADVAFKLISWSIVAALFRLAYIENNAWFHIVSAIVNLGYGFVIFLAALMLYIKRPEDFGFRGYWVYSVKTGMMLAALFLLILIISPTLEADKIANVLANVRTNHSK